MLLECGTFSMYEVDLIEAKLFAQSAINYSGHETVKILGIEPNSNRNECLGFDKALVIKPHGRLQFGKEYSIEEIMNIGYTIYMVENDGKLVDYMGESIDNMEWALSVMGLTDKVKGLSQMRYESRNDIMDYMDSAGIDIPDKWYEEKKWDDY